MDYGTGIGCDLDTDYIVGKGYIDSVQANMQVYYSVAVGCNVAQAILLVHTLWCRLQ